MLTRYLLLFFLAAANLASANPPDPQPCITDRHGAVDCAAPGGQAVMDREGRVVMGKGKCARNRYGDVKCSDTPGGGAAVNMFGKVVTGKGKCLANQYGEVKCANTPGGGAELNGSGDVRTGPGQCVRDSLGNVMCSSLPSGGAALDAYGKAVCSGGCVAGK